MEPTVTGEDAGGRPKKEFTVYATDVPCLFYSKSARSQSLERIKNQELGVSVHTLALPMAIGVTERWRARSVRDIFGRGVAGISGEVLEIIGPPVAREAWGCVVVDVRMAR